jgi:hypothetical protein
VVFERGDRASVPFVTSVNHPKYFNGPLDALPINNAGFQERIVLREALHTMRNSPAGYKPTVPFRKTYGFTAARVSGATRSRINYYEENACGDDTDDVRSA